MRFLKITSVLPLLLLMLPMAAMARPVSYPGGWTAMQQNNGMQNSLHLHYSPTATTSIGPRIEYFQNDHTTVGSLQLNKLLKRWNMKDAQANIYLKNGVGMAYQHQKVAPALWSGVATDWETRKLYASYGNRFLYAPNLKTFFNQHARIGFAPYVAEYGGIHTWLMFQVDHFPTEERELMLTPMIRLFKGPAMVEIGANFRGQILANLTYRF